MFHQLNYVRIVSCYVQNTITFTSMRESRLVDLVSMMLNISRLSTVFLPSPPPLYFAAFNSKLVAEKTQTDGQCSWKVVQTVLRNSIITITSIKSGTPPPTIDFGATSYVAHEMYSHGGMPRYLCGFIGCVKVS